MRKIIGIDIDDTVCVLAHSIDLEVAKRYNVSVNHKEYNLGLRYNYNGRKLSAGVVRKILYNYIDWANLSPVLDAIKFIKKLQRKGAKIIFITNRSEIYTPHVEETTRRWLNRYFNNYELVFTKNKLKVCKDLSVDYLIDNNHEVLLSKPVEDLQTKLMLYTGVMPTTQKDVGLEKYTNWESMFRTILSS